MDVGFRASPLPLLSPSANAVKQAHVQTLPALSGQAGRKGLVPSPIHWRGQAREVIQNDPAPPPGWTGANLSAAGIATL